MEKTIIYEVVYDENDVASINKLDSYCFINPLTNEKTWLIAGEEYVQAWYKSEFKDYNYFLTENEAKIAIEKQKTKDFDFLKLCLEFDAMCKMYDEENPFIKIGGYNIMKQNESFVNDITDPVYKHYLRYHLSTSCYLSKIHKKLLSVIEEE